MHTDDAGQSQGLSPAEYRFFRLGVSSTPDGAIIHFLLIFVFWFIGLRFMAYFNVLSVVLHILGYTLARRASRMTLFLSVVIVNVEVIVHAWLAVYFLGWGAGFQYYLVVLPAYVFFYPSRKVAIMFTVLSVLSLLALSFMSHIATPAFSLSEDTLQVFRGVNLLLTVVVIGLASNSFARAVNEAEQRVQFQFERAESLLANILPRAVAERLKAQPGTIADSYEEVSILFADIRGFTEFANTTKPTQLVETLNELFSTFDDLLDVYRVEKIKTIGDAYMVASGLAEDPDTHAIRIVEFARAMIAATAALNKKHGFEFSIKIGINSGPVVAGVIGKRKYSYDLWGDTVNVASRMEAAGEPDRIHITENTYRLIDGRYNAIKRVPLAVKGKGTMQTYFVDVAAGTNPPLSIEPAEGDPAGP